MAPVWDNTASGFPPYQSINVEYGLMNPAMMAPANQPVSTLKDGQNLPMHPNQMSQNAQNHG